MTDLFDNRATLPRRPKQLTDEPGFVDGIPVEELVRVTRELTARITNEDRQRLAMEATEAARSVQTAPPQLLQQFFKGKVDLDVELSRRFPGSPLVNSVTFQPPAGKRARLGIAQFLGQDGAAGLTFELNGGDLEASFLLSGMIAVRFSVNGVVESARTKFLELMRRANGICFLWSKEKWERDYFVFVVRERFARVYAFAPGRFDAAVRLTPDGLEQLVTWFDSFWGDTPSIEIKPDDHPSGVLSW
ncbi:MAG: hypothetical protein KF726_00280 [Anaerolineae bacterium]|nr:hypothetical protein [Anaerolineae bacterium]